MSKGVVLLSGGMDSAVTAWIAKRECEELSALTFKYGQRHQKEISCALQLGLILGVKRHKVLDLPLKDIGGSSLLGEGDIPTEGLSKGIPSTWVPQRNSIFLAFAFGWAEVLGYDTIYIGVNSVDYSGYPDCRPEFISDIEIALNRASKRWVENKKFTSIKAPVMQMRKVEEIRLGMELGVPFADTWSCYVGGEKACGLCDSCRLRLEAFKEVGVKDPVEYEKEV